MLYLYCFIDGSVGFSAQPPTAIDKESANNGELDIIQICGTAVTVKEFVNGEWMDLDKAKLQTLGGDKCHIIG